MWRLDFDWMRCPYGEVRRPLPRVGGVVFSELYPLMLNFAVVDVIWLAGNVKDNISERNFSVPHPCI
jgi:hypothetical protein